MQINDSVLLPSEVAALRLRELFASRGYNRYEMTKFEEYALYAANREFLGGADIVTFTDSNGRLLALRPDVTLSVAANADIATTSRVYYHENVYRRGGLAHEFRERAQCGAEIIGDVGVREMSEVVALAWNALEVLQFQAQSDVLLDISHVGYVAGLLEKYAPAPHIAARLNTLLSRKNAPELTRFCRENALPATLCDALTALCAMYGELSEVRATLEKYAVTDETRAALDELIAVTDGVKSLAPQAVLRIDFSLTQDMNYYSGIVFQGIATGRAAPVMSGGRYDGLMHRLGKPCGAIGFAVYTDEVRI
ncbi:MAG: ATP phosphoribosyltransferase regulatory subunit [Oscillospiraceae bacterium]|jgi:ATP phosphoribosyltransferase regulatory subunit|nr:ATP phosphoribosyltransferase regulatory subunit [Oscillospiraceae bacterium]